ncbi:MAG: LPXTG cell wall anchor domain-containing protein, partial [Cycloclasticus sp.]|nr:LPXTG cell wall anchor domain-containing protein [Cycloclasticus sp.]
MKRSTKAVAAFCLINSANLYALGIGDIETHSALNQVLKAKIPLISSKNEDPSNVRIAIASREAFTQAGIDRPNFLNNLRFTPVIEKNGALSIEVLSTSSIKEPFVNFILEVEWPQGRALKEFTILLDPPVTMSDVRTTPITLAKSAAPIDKVTANDNVNTYIAPAPQAAPAKEYGPTKNRDTVWGIAKKLVKTHPTATHEQMMLALYDNNPSAFYKKNINALKKGAVLQVPSNEQTNSRTGAQALSDYQEQNSLWSNSSKSTAKASKPNKTNDIEQAAVTNSAAKEQPEEALEEATLTLVTPDQELKPEVSVEGNLQTTPIGSDDPAMQASMAIEMATTLEQENKDVKSRLNDLEGQLDKLQRLLALKDQQLAELQSKKIDTTAVKPENSSVEAATNDSSNNNIILYAGGAILIALLGLFLARRKKSASEQNDDLLFTTPIPDEADDVAIDEKSISSELPVEDTSTNETLLSEFTPSEFSANQLSQEADPLAECDVYIAYGRYQQAEDLIEKTLAIDPGNQSYTLKLLDVYFASNDHERFEKVALSLEGLKETDPTTWNAIAEMGESICPDSPLFISPLVEEINTNKADNSQTDNETPDLSEIEIDIPAKNNEADEPPKDEFE